MYFGFWLSEKPKPKEIFTQLNTVTHIYSNEHGWVWKRKALDGRDGMGPNPMMKCMPFLEDPLMRRNESIFDHLYFRCKLNFFSGSQPFIGSHIQSFFFFFFTIRQEQFWAQFVASNVACFADPPQTKFIINVSDLCLILFS